MKNMMENIMNNEIDDSDSQNEKHDEPTISIV
jgi:hypothetical protein